MFGPIGKVCHKAGKRIWLSVQESSAVMLGMPIELDPADTGDHYSLSPMVQEVHRETITKGRGFTL